MISTPAVPLVSISPLAGEPEPVLALEKVLEMAVLCMTDILIIDDHCIKDVEYFAIVAVAVLSFHSTIAVFLPWKQSDSIY